MKPNQPEDVLIVNDLVKIFKGKKTVTAVDGISFGLKHGEILGLLGPNGAGKTTTIQMLISTLLPTSGSIIYFGKNLTTHRSEILQDVTYASGYSVLPAGLSVRENLEVFGRIYGLKRGELNTRAEKFLSFFGIEKERDRKTGQLSSGQMTRLALAKAFLPYPKVVLLDEPTASLDPEMAHEVRNFIRLQQKEHHVSILFTSHNMDEVSEMCDRVIFLKQGKIIASDTPAELAARACTARLHLVVTHNMELLIQHVTSQQIRYDMVDTKITAHIEERHIPSFLSAASTIGVQYSSISIERPHLEDYFLKVAKSQYCEEIKL